MQQTEREKKLPSKEEGRKEGEKKLVSFFLCSFILRLFSISSVVHWAVSLSSFSLIFTLTPFH